MGSGRAAWPAFDLTFSAPKSASVLFALGGEPRPPAASSRAHAGGGGRRAVATWSSTASRPCRRVGPERGRGPRPPGWSPGSSPTRSTATGTLTCTATSSWPTSSTARTAGGARATGAGSPPIAAAASAVYDAHLRAASTVGARRALGGRARPAGRDRRCRARAARRVLLARRADIRRRMHEVGAHSARARPRGLGGHPARQGAGAPFADSSRSGSGGPAPSAGTSELGRGRRDAASARGAACSTSTASPRSSRSRLTAAPGGATSWPPSRAAAPARRRGGPLERLVDRWVPGGRRSAWPSRCTSAVPSCRRNHLLRALGPRPLDPGRPRAVGRRRRRRSTPTGRAGGSTVPPSRSGPGSPPSCRRCRPPAWPTTSARRGSSKRCGTGSGGASRSRSSSASGADSAAAERRGHGSAPGQLAVPAVASELAPGRVLVGGRQRDLLTSLCGPRTSARPGAPRATASTGRRGCAGRPDRRRGPDAAPAVDRVADRRRRHLVVAGEGADVAQRRRVRDARAGRRSCRTATGSRPPPGPSAPRAWERSCRQASTSRPWPAPSLTMAGEVGDGGDVGHLVEREQGGWAADLVAGPGVGGIAHVADGSPPRAGRIGAGAVLSSRCRGCWCRRRTPRSRAAVCAVDARAPSVR